jgi:16S rRNA (cytidine1402-2'-O)-methyltransferase
VQTVQATLVCYESPKRVHKLLSDMCECLGDGRAAVVCRELTKRFEEISRGTLGELAAQFDGRDVKGEIVVLVDRAAIPAATDQTLEAALDQAMEKMSMKDAVALVAESFGAARRDVYQLALGRTRNGGQS